MSNQPHILMCAPDYFGIEYEINPWMNTERKVDHQLAVKQWQQLHSLLEKSGAKISLMPPVKGLPDLVFTANAALIYKQQAMLARFRHEQRQGETPHDRAFLEQLGLEVIDPPGDFNFEGAGDALFCGETLYGGYRMRSDAASLQQIGEMLDVRVIPLELIDTRYYHLDTCFCPLRPGVALYYPAAFDAYGQKVLQAEIEQLIEVEQSEAQQFACNAVVVGNQVFTNIGCDRLHKELTKQGFEPHATELNEFVKAGGSAKCLTLRLDGEEAF